MYTQVLSERSDPRDEAEYAGIVPFLDGMPAIADAYRALVRTRRWPRETAAAVGRFRERFAPRKVFERARIYDDLPRWGLGPQPSG